MRPRNSRRAVRGLQAGIDPERLAAALEGRPMPSRAVVGAEPRRKRASHAPPPLASILPFAWGGGLDAVLALDIGTLCGWADVRLDAVVSSSRLDLRPRSGDHPGLRWHRMGAWVRERLAAMPLRTAVAVEDVRSHERTDAEGNVHSGVLAAHCYGGLRGAVEAACYEAGRPVLPANVDLWKRGIGLQGSHASKDQVLERVRLLGYAPETQDEADAIGIGLYAWRAAKVP